MFAVFDDETQSWWYTEVDDHQAVEVSEETEDVMVISCVLVVMVIHGCMRRARTLI